MGLIVKSDEVLHDCQPISAPCITMTVHKKRRLFLSGEALMIGQKRLVVQKAPDSPTISLRASFRAVVASTNWA